MNSAHYRVKLSQGSLLLLHLAAVGHVWRDFDGNWVASTVHTKRNVSIRIRKLIHQGMLEAKYSDNFPKITEPGREYLRQHPLKDVLQAKVLR